MEELHEIAQAYFEVASSDIQMDAQNFFNEMDSNFDGKVCLHEFLDFMRQEEYLEWKSSDLFKQLCRGNKEHLEFMDVMTLYYIIQSGRPFCDGCNQFIKDICFCCIECFHCSNGNYCICVKCFKAKKYTIGHQSHRHQFVDNFTLLKLKRRDAFEGAAASNKVSSSSIEPCDQEYDGTTSSAHVPAASASLVPATSTSLAIVPAGAAAPARMAKCKPAFDASDALDAAAYGVLASQVCNIL